MTRTESGGDARGRRLYDRWARHPRLYGLVEADTRAEREWGIDRLGLSPGDSVVDVGCGPGSNFGPLSRAVGPGGEVVGYDYSAGMVERARRRAAEEGWNPVVVERADATEPFPRGGFDAATATTALSATSDPAAVVGNVHDALRPGGRFLVLDGELFEDSPAALLNPVLAWAFRTLSNWSEAAASAIRPALGATFERTVAARRIPPGIGFLAVVEKAGG
jgi:demethylmenaquinone methyltransferase/2-methoxy-6-polyprenyl-1,4-benzoquinol methylase